MFKRFYEFNESTSGEIFKPKRGVPVKFTPEEGREIMGELYDLIHTAYKEIGGHLKIRNSKEVFSDKDWNYWEGIDIHNDPDFDIIFFGQKTRFGIKFSGVGHDGSGEAKKYYLRHNADELKKSGHYIEASGKLAAILINKFGVPVIEDKEEVERVLGKTIEWHGEPQDSENDGGAGWYSRIIAGHPHEKILLGTPKGI